MRTTKIIAAVTVTIFAGTVEANVAMVEDLVPGDMSSDPVFLAECHGYLYFQIGENDVFSTAPAQLYRFHGPSNVLTSVINDDKERYGMTCFRDELFYFRGTGGTWGVYKFDGETESLFYDTTQDLLRTREYGMHRPYFIEYKSQLYFPAYGPRLLRTNGETAEVAWDMQTTWNPHQDEPDWFTIHNDELYFVAEIEDKESGRGISFLCKFDGTNGNQVANLNEITGDSTPIVEWLASFQNSLYFTLGDYPSQGLKVVEWDGQSVSQVNPLQSQNFGSMHWPAVFEDALFFFIYNREDGYQYQLWKYDGTSASKIVDMQTRDFGWTTPFQGSLFFAASDGTIPDPSVGLTTQLHKFDGDTVSVVKESVPYKPAWLTPYQGRLFFSAGGEATGLELWVYTPDGWTQPEVESLKPEQTDGTAGPGEPNNPDELVGTTPEPTQPGGNVWSTEPPLTSSVCNLTLISLVAWMSAALVTSFLL